MTRPVSYSFLGAVVWSPDPTDQGFPGQGAADMCALVPLGTIREMSLVCVCWERFQCPGVAVTKDHKWGGLEQQKAVSPSFGGCRWELEGLAGLHSP